MPQPAYEICSGAEEATAGRRANRLPLRDQGPRPPGPARAHAGSRRRRRRRCRARRARRVALARRCSSRSTWRVIEVTVNAFSAGGHFYPLTVTDRLTAAAAGLRRRADACRGRASSSRPRSAPSSRRRARQRQQSGIENGPSYTQVLVGPDGAACRRARRAARRRPRRRALPRRARRRSERRCALCRARRGDPTPRPCRPSRGSAAPASASSSRRPASCARSRASRRPSRRKGSAASASTAGRDIASSEFRRGADRAGAVLAVGDSREQALERADRAEATIRFETDVEALV